MSQNPTGSQKRTKPDNAPIDEILDEDILIGRGFQYESNPGNALFSETISSSVRDYTAATTRKEKTVVVKRIFDQLGLTSRFVKFHAATGRYHVVSEKEARQKISHALRYQCQLEESTEGQGEVDAQPTPDDDTRKMPAVRSVAAGAVEPSEEDQGHSRKRRRHDADDSSSLFSDDLLESVLGNPKDSANPTKTVVSGMAQPSAATVASDAHTLGSSSLSVDHGEADIGKGPLSSFDSESPPSKTDKLDQTLDPKRK